MVKSVLIAFASFVMMLSLITAAPFPAGPGFGPQGGPGFPGPGFGPQGGPGDFGSQGGAGFGPQGGPGFPGPGFGPQGGQGFGPGDFGSQGFGGGDFKDAADQFHQVGVAQVAPGVEVNFGGQGGAGFGGPGRLMPNFDHIDEDEMILGYLGPVLFEKLGDPEKTLRPLCPDADAIGVKARELLKDVDFSGVCREVDFSVDSCKDAISLCEDFKNIGPRGPDGQEITCPVDESKLNDVCITRFNEQQAKAQKNAESMCDQMWQSQGQRLQQQCQQKDFQDKYRDFKPEFESKKFDDFQQEMRDRPPEGNFPGKGAFPGQNPQGEFPGRGPGDFGGREGNFPGQNPQGQFPGKGPGDFGGREGNFPGQNPQGQFPGRGPGDLGPNMQPPSGGFPNQPPAGGFPSQFPAGSQPPSGGFPAGSQPPSGGFPAGSQPPANSAPQPQAAPSPSPSPSPSPAPETAHTAASSVTGLAVGFPGRAPSDLGPGDFGPQGGAGFGPQGGPGFPGPGFGPQGGSGDFGSQGGAGFGPQGGPGFPGFNGGSSSPDFCTEEGFKHNCLNGFQNFKEQMDQQVQTRCAFETKMTKRHLNLYCKQKEHFGDPYDRCVEQSTKGCEKMKNVAAKCKASANLDAAVELIKKKAKVECARAAISVSKTEYGDAVSALENIKVDGQTREGAVQLTATRDKLVLTAEEIEKIRQEARQDAVKQVLTLLGLNQDTLKAAASKQRQQVDNLESAKDVLAENCEKLAEGESKTKCIAQVAKLEGQIKDLTNEATSLDARSGGILGVLSAIASGK